MVNLLAKVASTTKDSIHVKWHIESSPHPFPTDFVQGFQIRYQAVGSTVVQYSQRLEPSVGSYDITQLHENTYYDICIKMFVRMNTSFISTANAAGPIPDKCVKGTTATDSLAVALGSTFGAFLALGFIVLLVFLAKWQHNRKMRKQKLMTSAGFDESGVEQLRGSDDPKDVFLGSGIQFPDDLAMSELSAQSSEVSIALYADQMLDSADIGVVQQSNAFFDAQSDGPNLEKEERFVHEWIGLNPYSPPDSGDGNWLLRPPPIPGVIMVPQPQRRSRNASGDQQPEKEEQRMDENDSYVEPVCGLGAKSSTDRNCGSEHPGSCIADCLRDAAGGAERKGGSNLDATAGATAEQMLSHRPLKPTSSNFW